MKCELCGHRAVLHHVPPPLSVRDSYFPHLESWNGAKFEFFRYLKTNGGLVESFALAGFAMIV